MTSVEGERPSEPIPVTVERAAAMFDVTDKTVRTWIRAGLPVIKAGSKGKGNGALIDLAELIPWYLEENALDVAKTRLASAQADKHEMENSVRRGELAEVSAVESTWTDLVLSCRAKLLSMPAKLGPRLTNVADPAILSNAIRDEIATALVELAAPGVEAESGRAAASGARKVRAASAVVREPVVGRKAKAEPREQRRARSVAD